MSDITPDPVPPDVPAATPPPDLQSDLDRFIATLSGFDPGSIMKKLDEIAAVPADLVEQFRASLEAPFADLTKAVNNLRKDLAKGSATPDPTPAPDPTPSPSPDPSPSPSPNPGSGGGGIAETLFGVPRVP